MSARTVSREGIVDGFDELVDIKDRAFSCASSSSSRISSCCFSICRLRSWKSEELTGTGFEAGVPRGVMASICGADVTDGALCGGHLSCIFQQLRP